MIVKNDTMSRLLADALDSLKLTEKNRELADRYLEPSAEESPKLLKEAEYQDFSLFTDLERQAAYTWCRELGDLAGEREREQFTRYVRFAAAVGGASACYVLIQGRNMDHIARKLTKEQRASFWAELYAQKEETLNQGFFSVLAGMGREDPELLVRAMEFCRGQNDAARILLAGEYLFCMSQKGMKNEQSEGQAAYLKERILGRLPELFQGKGCSETELFVLRDFIQGARGDRPMPAEISGVLAGKQASWDLLALLTCCACMALEHGEAFGSFLHLSAVLCAECGRNHFPGLCRYAADRDWFYGHARFFLTELPVAPKRWIEWSLRTREESVWRYMVQNVPEAFQDLSELDLWSYEHLLEGIRKMDAELYEKLYDPDVYRRKTAEELSERFEPGAQTVRDYLLGEASLDSVLPFVKEWRKNSSGYYGGKHNRLEKLRDDPKQGLLYRRALVLDGLMMRGAYFRHYMFDLPSGGPRRGLRAEEIEEILNIFGLEQMPVPYQLDTLAAIHESCYDCRSEEPQQDVLKECVKVLESRIGQWGEEYKKAARNGAAMTRIICIQTMALHGQEYRDALLACASDSSRQVQQVLLKLYEGHKEWEPQIIKMLGSRKQKERRTAVCVLKQWGVDSYRTELTEALEKEKNDKLAEYMRKLLGTQSETADLDELAAGCIKGSRRQKILWTLDPPFEKIHTKNGEEAPETYLQALLACYASMETPGVHSDAGRLADALQEGELSACMADLLQKWLDQGAEAKKKWVLYAASIHGGSEIIPLLYRQIREFPAKSRGAMAVEAVRALTLNGTPEALLLVDQISRKFRYRQVKQGAAKALADAAAELGISREELEDRIIPDLGFDKKMERMFDFGKRRFVVRLTAALETEVFGPDGRRLKSLPSPGKQDDPEKAKEAASAFREMKKQLKTVSAAQKLRMEQALLTGRTWSSEQWKALFTANPLMHPFAIGLIWGAYEGDVLKGAFRYMEDGTFNTAEEEEYAFPENGRIGLVHPAELSGEEWEAWKEQLSDYEVIQPVDQLSRPVCRPEEEELAETALLRFQGTVVDAAFTWRMIGQGWYQGAVEDGGEYFSFCRDDGDMRAKLLFSGLSAADRESRAIVYEAVFCRRASGASGEESWRTLTLGELPVRYFSEIVHQLSWAAAAETT